jgi:hypothetical protein
MSSIGGNQQPGFALVSHWNQSQRQNRRSQLHPDGNRRQQIHAHERNSSPEFIVPKMWQEREEPDRSAE